MTYVMLSAAVHSRNTFDKLRAVFDVWPDLLLAAAAEPGSGYLLRVNTKGDRVKLDCVYSPPGAGEGPKVQQEFT